MKLSVVIPVFNEKATIVELVSRVQAVDLPKELLIVDDFSTDGTRDILQSIEQQYDNVRVFYRAENKGKGAALRVGFKNATGDYVIIQDADLEYDPVEYPVLLNPLIEGNADVVYGSRFLTTKE